MTKEEIIKAVTNSLNISSFTAEALEKLMEAIRAEALEEAIKIVDNVLGRQNAVSAAIRGLK